MTKLA